MEAMIPIATLIKAKARKGVLIFPPVDQVYG
jgi:hypothetical protein